MANTQKKTRVWLGFLTYGDATAPYLPYFLASLRQQTYSDITIVCFDNTPAIDNHNTTVLKNFPEVHTYRSDGNRGFSAAYNTLIKEAVQAGADYFCIINPDTLLEPTALEYLIQELEAYPQCAAVAPTLRHWNFSARTKTMILDSCGLTLKSGLRFIDIGQGEEDKGQYKHSAIIGSSGAAGLFRLSALEAIKEKEQYFDEFFFMYKEDCDLAYRLHRAGYAARYVSQAIIYHDRTASGGSFLKRTFNRQKRSRAARRYAFINQHCLYIKYWRVQTLIDRLRIITDIVFRGLHALIFEPYLLGCYPIIIKARQVLKRY